jgi:hypothetical protein
MGNILTEPESIIKEQKLNNLLKKLPQSKINELIEYAELLVSRVQELKIEPKLGDRFAGVWLDDRTAEEIIAEIQGSRVNILENWK